MKPLTYFGTFLLGVMLSCSSTSDIPQEILKEYPSTMIIFAENETDLSRKDEVVTIDFEEIGSKYADFNPQAFVVFDGSMEIPSHFWSEKADRQQDKLTFVADFGPVEKKQFVICYSITGEKKRSYPMRTQAELSYKFGGEFRKNQKGRFEYMGGQFKNMSYLRVPPEHTDHSFYIRYEGPGWESDKVGYRFYLDWRNAIDIFGKIVPDMVLQKVGQDGFDSYHEMSDWGMDILKVGDALGVGGIGMWVEGLVNRVSETDSITCEILASGPIHSQIHTNYYGWEVNGKKYDLVSDLSIEAGSRLTRHDIRISGEPLNLCTGIVKHADISRIEYSSDATEWEYLATYGNQSLAGDQLGMAIFYKKQDLIDTTEDQNNFVVVLKPADGKVQYYFLAAWEKEYQGIQSEMQFKEYLETVRQKLNYPIKIAL
ncbi:MAG: DUF4861 domain-containing protein [bacterium]|nr:MAG: DUF4861 domain-containing protein [bacterium]